jgi:ligand-binding SRPBCC domain-containing protein
VSKIVTEAWVRAPISRVFAFFSDPQNLPRLMPAQVHATIEDMHLVAPPTMGVVESGGNLTQIAGPGSLITLSFRPVPFLPLRSVWVARILEYVPGSHFKDTQQQGPMKSWSHTHQFISEFRNGVEGTLVRDIVDFQLPFGLLGRVADILFVRALMKTTFRSRQRALATLLD